MSWNRESPYAIVGPASMCRPLHGTTKIWARQHGRLIEVRMGFQFPGDNVIYDENTNPFDHTFHDNYVRGIGISVPVAMNALIREAAEIAESYFL